MRFKISDASYSELGWLVEKLSLYPTAAFVGVKATDCKGRIVGMVGCDHFTFNSCQFFIATTTPAAWLSLLHGGFDLAFNRCRMNIAYGLVNSDNVASLRFTTKLGFTLKCRLKDGWKQGVDILVFELEKKDCLWLNPPAEVRRLRKARRAA